MFPNSADKYVEPSTANDIKYCFLCDWYDPQACLIRKYLFLYYPKDQTIEMIATKTRKKFLSRTKFEHIQVSDLFIGSKINVYSRQLHLTEFGDGYTKKTLGSKTEKTLGLIKPDGICHLGSIVKRINDEGLQICRARMVSLNKEQTGLFYKEHKDKPFFMSLVEYLSSGPVFAMELIGTDSVAVWRRLIGPTDVAVAKQESPDSLRALYGRDKTFNSFHGADSTEAAAREISFFFEDTGSVNPIRKLENSLKLENTTCCLIKPHIVKQGLAGEIITKIQQAGFDICGASVQEIETANAEEFYEVYRGVVAEYHDMCNHLCEGPFYSLELISSKNSAETVEEFRTFCGPSDPEIARHIRPTTLRAIYGKDKVRNAVHCTDLSEDGIIEAEYFLRILNIKP